MLILKAANEQEINAAFVTIVHADVGALLVGSGPVFLGQRRAEYLEVAPRRLPKRLHATEVSNLAQTKLDRSA
jgi:hypothetical protein